MKRYRTLTDVARLPVVTFGSRDIAWWGTVGFMAMEGTTLALCAASYFYLRKNFVEWPPPPWLLPSVFLPTVSALVLALSNIAMYRVHVAAKAFDKAGVQRWLLAICAIGVVAFVLRIFDFRALHIHWDSNAYGSITWVTIGFHTSLLLFEVLETIVLTLLFFTSSLEGKHFSDAMDNAAYWYFMTLSWLPLYVMIYLYPRLL